MGCCCSSPIKDSQDDYNALLQCMEDGSIKYSK